VIKPEEVKEIVISSTKTTETETPTPSIDVSNRPYKRYHIGIQAGFYKAVLGGVNFRYSSTPVVSLVIDSRTWGSSDRSIDVTSSFFGIGIRINGKDEQVKPFLQVSTYLVTENVEKQADFGSNILSENGIGIGLSTGLDIKVSELISIPVEINYIGTDGDDMDNLSWFGLSVGVSFNFWRIPNYQYTLG